MKPLYYLTLALLTIWAALPLAAEPEPVPPSEPAPAPPKPAPEQIWPAGLARIAGKYRFLQVASPGGLWQRMRTGDKVATQQVSLSQLPRALRERLENAEIHILDLQMPTTMEASTEKSPGVGGMIRHYTEEARGTLVMRGLPGIGGEQGDAGEYRGPVIFGIDHTSISNPTVAGVWYTRSKTEATWGASTLDFAELTAQKPLKEGQEAADPEYPIFNARILRSGVEIFAYIQWTENDAKGKENRREIWGTVRLIRAGEEPAPPQPAAAARRSE